MYEATGERGTLVVALRRRRATLLVPEAAAHLGQGQREPARALRLFKPRREMSLHGRGCWRGCQRPQLRD